MPAVNRYYSSVAVDTTLSFSITSSDLTLVVGSTAGFPTSYPYTLAVGYDLSNEELVTIVGASGSTLTVGTTVAGGANIAGRGVDGTNDQAHAAGEPVKHVISARDMAEAQAHIAAEADIHGLAVAGPAGASGGTVVGTTASQTLTNKTITGGTVNATTLQKGGLPVVTTTGVQELTDKTLTSPIIASPTISGTITGSVVTSANIVDGTITGTDIATGTITSTNILDGTVTGSDIASGTITSTNIADGTIVNADISASAAIAASKLSGVVTPTSSDILTNKGLTSPVITGGTLNGGAALTVTSTELNKLDGVSSTGVQISALANLIASRAVVTNSSGNVASPATTAAEIGYLNGVTSAIQTQLNSRLETSRTGAKVFIQTSTPASPTLYDIWIDY